MPLVDSLFAMMEIINLCVFYVVIYRFLDSSKNENVFSSHVINTDPIAYRDRNLDDSTYAHSVASFRILVFNL